MFGNIEEWTRKIAFESSMKYFGILAYHASYFDCLPFLQIEAVTSYCDTIGQDFCIFVIDYFLLEVIDTIDDDIFFIFD